MFSTNVISLYPTLFRSYIIAEYEFAKRLRTLNISSGGCMVSLMCSKQIYSDPDCHCP